MVRRFPTRNTPPRAAVQSVMIIAAPPAPTGLDDLLAGIDVRIRRQQRVRLSDGGVVAIERDALSLVYAIQGGFTTRSESRHAFGAGDLFFTTGRLPATIVADGPASLLVSVLELAGGSAGLGPLLPDTGFVRGFDVREPAAAALAGTLGTDAGDAGHTKLDGDQVICRMMARTMVASALRAWSRTGCAPAGWPSRSNDPYIDRVVDAIHADPGRDWTVGSLASIGAMSRTVFAERFRAALGHSPAGYVTLVRMRAAQDLLTRGLGVSAVSRELGYASDEGFSRAFRRHTGVTPSAWRAERVLTMV